MKIIHSGIASSKPENFIKKYVSKNLLRCGTRSCAVSDYGNIWIVAMGKAADTMTKSIAKIIPIAGGIVVIPKNYAPVIRNKKFQIIRAGHPTPDSGSVFAGKTIRAFLKNTSCKDLVVFLVSGGTSSLVCAPEGVTLEQKIKTSRILLESGASINEINAIRKHISAVKGGKILDSLCCTAISYVMSDVVNNDLGSIGSGIVFCDKTTFSDCIGVVKKYGLEKKLPKSVLSRLRLGAMGKISETPKKPKIPNQIIAQNSDCLDAMKTTAKKLGYSTLVYPKLTGDVELAAKKILKKFNAQNNTCVIFGGETTVKVRGNGKGGRNQELVLRMISQLPTKTLVASLGTDGIDGNTKNAGAIFDHPVSRNLIKQYLENNDSNSFFVKHGGLITTKPTHSNLLDIGLILKKL